jgi:hypothetical protein
MNQPLSLHPRDLIDDRPADGIFGVAPLPWPAADHAAGAAGKLAG